MRILRVSLAVVTVVSTVTFVATVVGWVRSYPHTGCLGLARVRDASPNLIAVDSYTVQGSRGQVWFGRCRVSVFNVLGFRVEPSGGAEGLATHARNLDVFAVPEFAGPLGGFGLVSGVARDDVPLGVIGYEISGLVLPCWFLALVTGVLPALGVYRLAKRTT